MWPFRKKKSTKKQVSTSQYAQIECLKDDVELVLPGCSIKMSRNACPTLPHELSIILPRIEIRRRCPDKPECEEEIILSSITVVDAPRHPFEVPPEAKLPSAPTKITIPMPGETPKKQAKSEKGNSQS